MIRSKHQKGSMMIEVVAVVALLALLTPLLFRQIQRRTDEVDNVRIASIMREAKDILQRAIEDNLDELGDVAVGLNGENDCIRNWPAAFHNTLSDYAPSGQWPNGLDFYICRHLVDNDQDRPVYYGAIVDVSDDLPFLAAADIATMIGAEGGVCTAANHATGVRNGWDLNNIGAFQCDATDNQVVAITSLVGSSGFGSINAVHVNDYIAADGTMQADVGYGTELYAEDILAVGRNCVSDPWTPDAERDPNCQPIFEVSYFAADGVTPLDNPEVRLGPNTKLVFQNDAGTHYAAPATGDQVAIPVRDSSVVTQGGQQGPDDGFGPTDDPIEYAVDAKGDSVMKNIRLLDRGNALLTDLLPNYVLKGVLAAANNCAGAGCNITNIWTFDCPPYHKKAVIVEGCVANAVIDTAGTGTVHCQQMGRAYQYCVYNGN